MKILVLFLLICFTQTTVTAQSDGLKLEQQIDSMSWQELSTLIDTLFVRQEYNQALEYSQSLLEIALRDYGKKHENYIESLFYLGGNHFELGNYLEALPYLQESIERAEKHLAKDNERIPVYLSKLPRLYQKMGAYDKALVAFEKAIDYTEENFGRNYEFYGSNLNDLAIYYQALGDFETAIKYNKESLQHAANAYGKIEPEYANRLNVLASVYQKMGDYEKAIPLYEQSIKIYRNKYGKKHNRYIIGLNNLGTTYFRLGEYEKAIPYFQEALTTTENLFGKDHPKYAIRLNNLAALYFRTGQYERALPLFKEALIITEKSLGKNHEKYGIRLGNLGALYLRLGQYDTVVPLYLAALENTEKTKGKEHSEYARYLHNLAALYKRMGQWKKALPYQLEANAIAKQSMGEDDPDYSNRVSNLGEIYMQLGRYDEALALYQEALASFEKFKGKDHPEYGDYLMNVGESYLTVKRFGTALPFIQDALAHTERTVGTAHFRYADRLEAMGAFYDQSEQLERAVLYYQQSLKVTQKVLGERHPNYGKRLCLLALAYEKTDQLDKAYGLYQQACRNFEHQLTTYYPSISEQERIIFLQTLSTKINQLFSFTTRYPQLAKEVQDLNLTLKGLALSGSIAAKNTILTSRDSSLQETYLAWTQLRRSIGKAYTLSLEERAEQQINLDSLQQAAEQLEGQLSRSSLEVKTDQQRAIRFANLQQHLSKKEAAIDIVHFPYHDGKDWTDEVHYYALLTLAKSTQPHFIFIGKERQLRRILRAKVRRGGANYVENARVSHDLYQTLWQPLMPFLKKVKTVHLSPAGLLHKVAFNALKMEQEKDVLLMDRFNILLYGNLQELLDQQDFQANTSITLVGGALYDLDSTRLSQLSIAPLDTTANYTLNTVAVESLDRSVTEDSTRAAVRFNYLPGTEQEVKNIATQFQQKNWTTQLLTGEQALEDRIQALSAQSTDILHIATHGFFFKAQNVTNDTSSLLRDRIRFAQHPLLRSGLVFTGVNHSWKGGQTLAGMEDGVLTAYEISNLDLFQTNLVVLSACQTGLGDVQNGEGVFGLQRAFKTAGVEHLIISLWKVSDRETAELMQLFYQNYLTGMTVEEAFYTTQQTMRETYSPYYWAGFVLVQ